MDQKSCVSSRQLCHTEDVKNNCSSRLNILIPIISLEFKDLNQEDLKGALYDPSVLSLLQQLPDWV